MNRQEAKEALNKGKKLRHRYFSSDEWIRQAGIIVFTEEGYSIDAQTFWGDRSGAGFDEGWEIVE